jgi:hypothetical protein
MKTSVTPRRATILPIVLACCSLLYSFPVASQDPEPAPPAASDGLRASFGVKGGANWSNLRVKDVRDENWRVGFHAGLLARFASPKSLGFQIEALYDQKGSTFKRTYGTIDQEITYEFDYITVPAMIIIPLGEVFELHGGAYAGYMASSMVRSTGDLGDASIDINDSRFNGFDYGLLGGAALNLGLAQIGVRYQHGLNEISDGDISRMVLGQAQNSTFQAYLALVLGKQ